MAKLSKRMLMNVTLIPPGGRVADIGCDHAMVPIYLVSKEWPIMLLQWMSMKDRLILQGVI